MNGFKCTLLARSVFGVLESGPGKYSATELHSQLIYIVIKISELITSNFKTFPAS